VFDSVELLRYALDHDGDLHAHRVIGDLRSRVARCEHAAVAHSGRSGVPQGRGKVERFLGTITTELLPTLPGHIAHGTRGKPITAPALSPADLDTAIGKFIDRDAAVRAASARSLGQRRKCCGCNARASLLPARHDWP
jgi:hypothetical protein